MPLEVIMEVDLGISKKALQEIVDKLGDILADTYAVYLKAQNFHWNVTGPEFFSLHLLFEKNYEDLADAADEIAERIRAIGGIVDATFSAFHKRTSIPEPKKRVSAKHMIKELMEGHEEISRKGRPMIPRFQELKDEASADLLIKRLGIHEKAAWMLRAHLEAMK